VFLLAPPHDSFSYAYWRTSYLMSGRTVLLPLPQPDLDHADLVAVQGVPFSDPRFDQVWSGASGETIWRRR
jgi:hypothetical protein